MKQIAPELVDLIASTHGYADVMWTQAIPIPGDPEFPVLQLPEPKLAYSTERGYPIKLAPRKLAGRDRPLLFVQIESFALATHDQAGWATPSKYTPRTDEERIAHALGFDEGWDDAAVESIFICDERFAVFWRAARDRGRFGLTGEGASVSSLYAVTLGAPERDALGKVLKHWPKA